MGIHDELVYCYKQVYCYLKQGEEEYIEMLIDNVRKRTKLEPQEMYGNSLCIAANKGDIETARFCKDKGADLDYQDHNKRTPLWCALRAGQTQMAETLREWGACKDTHEYWGKPSSSVVGSQERLDDRLSPSDINELLGYLYKKVSTDIKEDKIEDAEIRVESFRQRRKWEPQEMYGKLLCIAANKGDIETARFCKDRGADLDHQEDYRKGTPLWYALRAGQTQMAETLREWGACKDTHELWSKPSSDLESPSCSSQEKQSRHPKRRCGLI